MHPVANPESHIDINMDTNKQPKVIIADDDPSILLLLKHILTSEGYEVTQSSSGIDAVDLCKHNTYDLAILDIVMPDMDGFSACKIINKQITNPPPVLLVTSLDDDISVDHAFNCGAIEYITKPINWSVFKHRVRRIIENKLRQEVIHRLEHHNPLTGLPNRTLMLDRLRSALLRSERSNSFVTLIMIDIDNFKLINETLGHDSGDQLLQSVAKRLELSLRESDTLSHPGGDEFCILVENIEHLDDITVITEKISRTLEYDINLTDHPVHVKASMGITVYPQDGSDISTLLGNADIALHKAKENDNITYEFFSPELSQKAMRRLKIENDLRHAIDNNQLVLHYQPKISLSSLNTKSMEALVRWQHPEHGLMPPDEFINVAEDSGLIIPLGEWVIRTACNQFQKWIKQGLEVSQISINVSAKQFRQKNVIPLFDSVLKETGISPSAIELEITENTLLKSEDFIDAQLNTLHNMGIGIAIDEFGTGYASLSYLKKLPIDTLKIDCSFTDGILNDEDDIAIINAIVGLAKAMGMRLVAEGIESELQLQKLRELDVDFGQGCYWSPAIPEDQYSELLSRLNPS